MFITFEGVEGSGKSTCIRLVSEMLSAQDHQVLVTREPGAGEFGARIRSILLDGVAMPAESELFLFLADRSNHVQTIIKPALEQGEIVLCDRHADSTLVYQGYARSLDRGFLRLANQFATQNLVPNLTLVLDLDPKIGLARIAAGRVEINRLDREPLEFHQRVRAGFLELSKQEPDRFEVIDATKPPEQIASEVYEAIKNRLGDCD